MSCFIKNNTNYDLSELTNLTKQFYPFAQKRLQFNDHPTIIFNSDLKNAKNPLGSTGHYEPQNSQIVIMVDNRHLKDVLRSLAHELVHHSQNCRGDLVNPSNMELGYAQKDDHLRELEREAYEQGNLCFRDWEDGLKKTNIQLYETIYKINRFKGENFMSTQDWKNKELNTLLMEKWGFKVPEKNVLKEEKTLSPFLDTKADYRGMEKELPEEELDEEDDDVTSETNDPMEAGNRMDNLEETALYKTVLQTVKDILSEKNED